MGCRDAGSYPGCLFLGLPYYSGARWLVVWEIWEQDRLGLVHVCLHHCLLLHAYQCTYQSLPLYHPPHHSGFGPGVYDLDISSKTLQCWYQLCVTLTLTVRPFFLVCMTLVVCCVTVLCEEIAPGLDIKNMCHMVWHRLCWLSVHNVLPIRVFCHCVSLFTGCCMACHELLVGPLGSASWTQSISRIYICRWPSLSNICLTLTWY